MALDELRNKFGYIAKKFPHIVFKRLSQVAVIKRFQRIHDYARNQSPVELFNELAKDKADSFDLVSKLGTALLTAYNASSSAEGDISMMVFI